MKKKILYGITAIVFAFIAIACSNTEDYVPKSIEANSLILSETFADTLGAFTAVSVIGDQKWAVDKNQQYAYMSGYVNSTNHADEDWLISPEIDLTNVKAAYFAFDHVARYFTDPVNEATVWITDNYTGDVTTATWIQVHITPFKDPGSYTFENSGQQSLTPYAGKKIRIALKYSSTATKAGTWRVRNFIVSSGEAIALNFGGGTQTNPYTVFGGTLNQSGGNGWVSGYIIGYAWNRGRTNSYYFNADTCTQTQNILIADSGNIYLSKCIAVQLPRGNIRKVMNLKDNKLLLGKKVKVFGTLSSFLGLSGVVNPTQYVLPDGTYGTSSITTYFAESFAANLGAFTAKSVSGAQAWRWISGYASMSGFANSVNNPNEDWLISPPIDLTSLTSAALSFDHTINKGVVANMKTEQTLWISADDGANWTQLAIPSYPAGNNWTFVNSGEINLDSYAGKTIKIAFKYLSTTASSGNWEIKNFLVYY